MRRAFGDIAISDLPNPIRNLWYSRNEEPEDEEFDRLPDWMGQEPPDQAQERDLERVVAYLFTTITEREASVLIQRYWLENTLEECGKQMNITRERVRQIEMKAIRKLRHPSRSALLALAIDIPKGVIEKYGRYWSRFSAPSPEFIEWIRESPYKKVGIGVAQV